MSIYPIRVGVPKVSISHCLPIKSDGGPDFTVDMPPVNTPCTIDGVYLGKIYKKTGFSKVLELTLLYPVKLEPDDYCRIYIQYPPWPESVSSERWPFLEQYEVEEWNGAKLISVCHTLPSRTTQETWHYRFEYFTGGEIA